VNFGRQNNMSRRAHRADENFHRGKRRRGIDHLAMLEAAKAGPRPPSAVRRMMSAIASVFSPRKTD
jgi:hypothetical protein